MHGAAAGGLPRVVGLISYRFNVGGVVAVVERLLSGELADVACVGLDRVVALCNCSSSLYRNR
jgi:hypothetical protein